MSAEMEVPDQPVAGPSSIPLYLINGVATIWDAQTAATLHCQYDISGLRAGTLPGVSQQNGFLGLPMTLMQEETAYLVQQGIAHLVPVRSTALQPSESLITQQRQARIARISELERKGMEEARRVAEEGKRRYAESGDKAKKKREERARVRAEKASLAGAGAGAGPGGGGGGDTSGFGLDVEHNESTSTTTSITRTTDNPQSQPKPQPKPESSIPTPASTKPTTTTTSPDISSGYTSGHFHTIPSHPSLPPLSLAIGPSSLITSLPHPLFPFPTTPRHRALLRTFTSLQSLGYRIGLGPRFGGEYLIYPGDYLRYHAHFTSQVLVDDEPILPTELVAWGRLGTGTKKAGLICCTSSAVPSVEPSGEVELDSQVREDRDKGGVEYYSLEWANFG